LPQACFAAISFTTAGNFFKSRGRFLVLRMMARPCRELAKSHAPQLAAERLLGDRDAELFEEPLRQIDETRAHDAMDGRDRAVLHDLPQGLALMVVEEARSARRLAGQETVGTVSVEAKNPMADDLQSDAANPRRGRAWPPS
jgi:hypothetical protein